MPRLTQATSCQSQRTLPSEPGGSGTSRPLRMRLARSTLVGLVLGSTLLTATASAQPTPKQARLLAKEYQADGEREFKGGEYAEAAQSFLEMENLLVGAGITVPSLLYHSLARCYDQMGQIEAAMRYYTKFIALARGSGGRRVTARKQSQEAKQRLQSQLDRTALAFKVEPDGTEVRIDRRVVGTTPLAPVKVTPGPHQVTLWAEGYEPRSLDLESMAGSTVPVITSLSKVEAAPPPALTPPEPSRPVTSLIALSGVAFSSTVAAVFLLARASSIEDEGSALTQQVLFAGAHAEQVANQVQSKYDEAGLYRGLGFGFGLAATASMGAVLAVWLHSGEAPEFLTPSSGQGTSGEAQGLRWQLGVQLQEHGAGISAHALF